MNPGLRSFAALSVCVAFAGCMQTTEPLRPPPPADPQGYASPSMAGGRAQRGPFHLSTSVEMERSMVTGGVADVVLSVTSHEREPVTLRFHDSCQLEFVAYDRGGIRVDEGWSCFFFGSTLTLAPGQTVRQSKQFRAARYDEQLHAYVPLPTGTYRFHALLNGLGYYSPPLVVRLVAETSEGGL
jgi:hypothetical protein